MGACGSIITLQALGTSTSSMVFLLRRRVMDLDPRVATSLFAVLSLVLTERR